MRLLAGCLMAALAVPPAFAWEYWGGDQGGTRFSKLDQITPQNVGSLVRAWEYRTGDLQNRPPEAMKRTKFEATPLFVEDSAHLLLALQRGDRARSRHRRAKMAF